ncbi:hypothetical protein FH972_014687 [Carpinus fangiana]|uniref:Uncharacterized protein n=1 Tax=Carpinus fangiana TaxID=176857 RepID=A0A5N6RE33_9ROSI|nr:hypothetical protein FH972_014687 [Carpinus fangiana]
MEIMRLKPSFARKLNQDGFTPIHLAMQNGETRVVLRLLDVDNDLVRIQGREGITPLHFAAQRGDLDLLVAFLRVCPDSIEDVTVQRETVLHIALTNGNFDAFQLLLGWLRRAWFKDAFSLGRKLLNWQDEEGNTVLHIAISRDQSQIVGWLTKFPLDINIENRSGFTAFEILENEANLVNEAPMRRMLCCARARRPWGLRRPLADYLRSPVGIDERVYVYFIRQRSRITTEMRAALLVVVVLLITISFQTVLKPPAGILLDNTATSNRTAPTNVKRQPQYLTTTLFMLENSLKLLMFFTAAFFFAAISAILYLLPFGHFVLAGPICRNTCQGFCSKIGAT